LADSNAAVQLDTTEIAAIKILMNASTTLVRILAIARTQLVVTSASVSGALKERIVKMIRTNAKAVTRAKTVEHARTK